MKHDWLPMLLVGSVLLVSLAVLLRMVLRAVRRPAALLPDLKLEQVLFPLGPFFSGNDAGAVAQLGTLLAPGSQVLVALIYEVPRATALDKAQPDPLLIAQFDAVRKALSDAGVAFRDTICPCRNALEETLKLANSHHMSGIFVQTERASDPNPCAGLLERAPCTVLISHPN